VTGAARPILPGSLVNPSMVDQQVSAMVIISIGMARPNTVSAADSRRVSESLAPSTRAAGRWTSSPSRAISDRCPRGGLGWTAATGDTRPAHQAGMTVAIATVSTVPTAISAIQAPDSGARPTGVPPGGWMNAGRVMIHAASSPSPAPTAPSRVCSATSIRTTCPGVNPSAFSIAMSWRCTRTRPAVTLAIAHGAATRAMMPNRASSSPSSRSLLAIELFTCCQVEYRSTAEAEFSAGPL